jgi:hypothetical protein
MPARLSLTMIVKNECATVILTEIPPCGKQEIGAVIHPF